MRGWVLAAAVALVAAAAPGPASIAGSWTTAEGKAVVAVAPCGTSLCGRIVRVIKPGRPGRLTDTNNPDPALRERPIAGLVILTGFLPAGDRWKGRIYDPESGRSYRSELVRHGDTLDVKGCFGPFCRTQHWTAAR